MLSVFYLKKFIVKVLVNTRKTHFSSLLLLDPLLIQVLNIVVDLVFPVHLLQVMMAQEERGPMIVVILNDGGDIADQQQSQYPLGPLTSEDNFTHAT